MTLLLLFRLRDRQTKSWLKSASGVARSKTVWKAIHFRDFRFVCCFIIIGYFRIFRFILLQGIAETGYFSLLFNLALFSKATQLLLLILKCWNLQVQLGSLRLKGALAFVHSELSFILTAFWWFYIIVSQLECLLWNNGGTYLFKSNARRLVAFFIFIMNFYLYSFTITLYWLWLEGEPIVLFQF